jgi:hypothetical protein
MFIKFQDKWRMPPYTPLFAYTTYPVGYAKPPRWVTLTALPERPETLQTLRPESPHDRASVPVQPNAKDTAELAPLFRGGSFYMSIGFRMSFLNFHSFII